MDKTSMRVVLVALFVLLAGAAAAGRTMDSIPSAVDGALRSLPDVDRLSDDVGVRLRQVFAGLESVQASSKGMARDAALRGVWDSITAIFDAILNFIRLMMDPAPLGDYSFTFDNKAVLGYLSFQALNVGHLRNLVVDSYKLDIFKLCVAVDLRLPQLTIKTLYDADVTLDLSEVVDDTFRVFGSGSAQIDVWNVTAHCDVCVTLEKLSVKVSNMHISVPKVLVDIKNLFGGGAISDLISGIATDVVPEIVKEYQPQITEFLTTYINNLIRSKLPSTDTTAPHQR